MTKVCPRCKRDLPVDRFSKRSETASGLASKCKDCAAAWHQHKKSTDPTYLAKRKEGRDRWRRADLAAQSRRQAMWKYGLTREQYEALQAITHCEACGDELFPGTGGKSIDHDHDTGKVRGMLCRFCNTLEGNIANGRVALVQAYLDRRGAGLDPTKLPGRADGR